MPKIEPITKEEREEAQHVAELADVETTLWLRGYEALVVELERRETKREGLQPSAVPLYYIQNTGYCGNCIKFWCIDGHGYTLDLKQAWKVPQERADKICRSRPHEDIPLLASDIDAIAQLHVNSESLRG